jgi:hypothetical protein
VRDNIVETLFAWGCCNEDSVLGVWEYLGRLFNGLARCILSFLLF